MTKFIDVSNDTKEVKKETVFTEYLSKDGKWTVALSAPSDFILVNHLAKYDNDFSLFCAIDKNGAQITYKGIKGDEFN